MPPEGTEIHVTFELYDRVMLTEDLVHQNGKAGEVGTIIEIYPSGYEVDLWDDCVSVLASQIVAAPDTGTPTEFVEREPPGECPKCGSICCLERVNGVLRCVRCRFEERS